MSDIFLYVSSCIQWNIIKNMVKKKKRKKKKGRKGHSSRHRRFGVSSMPEGMQGFNGWLVDGAVFPKIQMGQLFVSTVYVEAFFFL